MILYRISSLQRHKCFEFYWKKLLMDMKSRYLWLSRFTVFIGFHTLNQPSFKLIKPIQIWIFLKISLDSKHFISSPKLKFSHGIFPNSFILFRLLTQTIFVKLKSNKPVSRFNDFCSTDDQISIRNLCISLRPSSSSPNSAIVQLDSVFKLHITFHSCTGSEEEQQSIHIERPWLWSSFHFSHSILRHHEVHVCVCFAFSL